MMRLGPSDTVRQPLIFCEFDNPRWRDVYSVGQIIKKTKCLRFWITVSLLDKSKVLFHYYSLGGDTAMPGGLHGILINAFLV